MTVRVRPRAVTTHSCGKNLTNSSTLETEDPNLAAG